MAGLPSVEVCILQKNSVYHRLLRCTICIWFGAFISNKTVSFVEDIMLGNKCKNNCVTIPKGWDPASVWGVKANQLFSFLSTIPLVSCTKMPEIRFMYCLCPSEQKSSHTILQVSNLLRRNSWKVWCRAELLLSLQQMHNLLKRNSFFTISHRIPNTTIPIYHSKILSFF